MTKYDCYIDVQSYSNISFKFKRICLSVVQISEFGKIRNLSIFTFFFLFLFTRRTIFMSLKGIFTQISWHSIHCMCHHTNTMRSFHFRNFLFLSIIFFFYSLLTFFFSVTLLAYGQIFNVTLQTIIICYFNIKLWLLAPIDNRIHSKTKGKNSIQKFITVSNFLHHYIETRKLELYFNSPAKMIRNYGMKEKWNIQRK